MASVMRGFLVAACIMSSVAALRVPTVSRPSLRVVSSRSSPKLPSKDALLGLAPALAAFAPVSATQPQPPDTRDDRVAPRRLKCTRDDSERSLALSVHRPFPYTAPSSRRRLRLLDHIVLHGPRAVRGEFSRHLLARQTLGQIQGGTKDIRGVGTGGRWRPADARARGRYCGLLPGEQLQDHRCAQASSKLLSHATRACHAGVPRGRATRACHAPCFATCRAICRATRRLTRWPLSVHSGCERGGAEFDAGWERVHPRRRRIRLSSRARRRRSWVARPFSPFASSSHSSPLLSC